jgi:hypothetical protein
LAAEQHTPLGDSEPTREEKTVKACLNWDGSLDQLRAHVIGELELSGTDDDIHAIGHVDALIGGVMRIAFDAGWNATKWVMCNQSHDETERSMRKQQEDALHAFAESFGFHAMLGSVEDSSQEHALERTDKPRSVDDASGKITERD